MLSDQPRPAAVAGLFYPANPGQLQAELDGLLREGAAASTPLSAPPKALIVPHAGYVYSGPIAARAYAALRPAAGRIRRVVLLGPAHRVGFKGLAVPTHSRFASPLGEVEVDQEGVQRLLPMSQVTQRDDVHAEEHALEVQLPFLLNTLDHFSVLPVLVGHANAEEVAEVLEAVWGGEETLVLISSDLSHYLPQRLAMQIDRATTEQIVALNEPLDHEQACGATPINGLLRVAKRRGMTAHLLDRRTSADTAGSPERVVGYCSVAFSEAPAAGMSADPDPALGRTLLQRARRAIRLALNKPVGDVAAHPALQQPAACFVSLRRQGELRGCRGTLEACQTLELAIEHSACAAAFDDSRFPCLRADELDDLHIEVSLLSPLQPLAVESEQHLLQLIRPGVDGLLLELHGRRGTFLPQVWQALPQPADFLRALKHKAGLAADFWSAELRVYRYQVQHWSEPA
ncbi:AmmeMemoRadiSam system protein B [Pseudomarimonas arenosa]|uniref:MEMO1 family protein IFO71_12785 n=1 Tax=Pseudomarimonas arenosa TaxID=2774145 RepID=A0AAW3ZLJ8_9GAMM|nr:AmmeMemoRadiSam system protein B [Pseudomarimonas arenosa]MBD8526613.1 AmmeMemoRadiSam system protein B [Pseudomarimonas arenosa]